MTLGLHPVSNSTSPLGCSIRNDGHGRSSIVLSPPCIRRDIGAESCAPGRAHIRRTLDSAISHLTLGRALRNLRRRIIYVICHIFRQKVERASLLIKPSIDDGRDPHYTWRQEPTR